MNWKTTAIISLALAAVALRVSSAATAVPTSQLSLNGVELASSAAPVSSSYSAEWRELMGLESFGLVEATIPGDQFVSLLSNFRLKDGQPFDTSRVMWAFLYSDLEAVVAGSVPGQNILGASVIERHLDGGVTHKYFERVRGRMKEIGEYSVKVRGPLPSEVVLMMHFAATGAAGMPSASAIYDLSNEDIPTWPFGFEWNAPDTALTMIALQDDARSIGARTIGVSGSDDLSLAIIGQTLAPDCETNVLCEDNTNDKDYCCKSEPRLWRCFNNSDGTDCMARDGGELLSQVQAPVAPPPYATLWEFRDEFLASYQRGVQYKNRYYILSRFAKMDVASALKYSEFYPLAVQAIDILMNESSDAVVITPELFAASIDIIELHRDIENQLVQDALDSAEEDLNEYIGLTRSQFISKFGEPLD
ncbi:MAG: hypothetical protein H6831_10530 [Planctomycetes bacterium]|nr:hypothetical protein [Planctomycetota bacterium]